MTRLWELLAVLALWAAIVTVRRKRAHRSEQSPQSPSGHQEQVSGKNAKSRGDDPDIDYDELEQAEREVKDLDTDAKGRPLDDVIGDDWGPGTPKPPYT